MAHEVPHSFTVRISTPSLMWVAAVLAGVLAYGGLPSIRILWLDFDMKNIPEPKERANGFYDHFFKDEIVEHAKENLDVARWARRVAGRPKPAANANALDEVPDSSWYTNRHYLHRMTIEELVRGPNRGAPPDFTGATITKAKANGVTPGFSLRDTTGQTYLIKFDSAQTPGNRSAGEVISTKILYAAGYNVPENYIAYIDASQLHISEDAGTRDETGRKHAFTPDDLNKMLERIARMPDGRYRAMASKIIPGKPKGPFSHVGFRKDDPNDLIPHEHRRELRALRVISSWINNWDLKEGQSVDMYVEENGRHFLRHYLLDFNSALGGDTYPFQHYHGHEYGFDPVSIFKEIVSLGAYQSADEKPGMVISPAVGMFTARDFDPAGWRPTYPSVMFDNLTDQDAFWATRIILSFKTSEIRCMVETGEYADPKDTDYIVETLLERRNILAKYWLSKVDALSEFSIEPAQNGVVLAFRDLMVDCKLADADSKYIYEIKGPHYSSAKKTTPESRIFLDRPELAAAIEHTGDSVPIQITIWTDRPARTSPPVTIEFVWNPTRGASPIQRIFRG